MSERLGERLKAVGGASMIVGGKPLGGLITPPAAVSMVSGAADTTMKYSCGRQKRARCSCVDKLNDMMFYCLRGAAPVVDMPEPIPRPSCAIRHALSPSLTTEPAACRVTRRRSHGGSYHGLLGADEGEIDHDDGDDECEKHRRWGTGSTHATQRTDGVEKENTAWFFHEMLCRHLRALGFDGVVVSGGDKAGADATAFAPIPGERPHFAVSTSSSLIAFRASLSAKSRAPWYCV